MPVRPQRVGRCLPAIAPWHPTPYSHERTSDMVAYVGGQLAKEGQKRGQQLHHVNLALAMARAERESVRQSSFLGRGSAELRLPRVDLVA
jgi:hypothetical protein